MKNSNLIKRLMAIACLGAVMALSACGGDAGSPAANIPTPTPPATGTTAQTITFAKPADMAVPATATLAPTASSGLAVTLASGTPTICTVSGFTVTAIGAGTCSLTASQSGDATYAAATSVTQTMTITASTGTTAQTITFVQPADLVLPATATLAPTASSGLVVSLASTTPTVCIVEGFTVKSVAAGSCILTASQGGNSVYAAATPVVRTLNVTAGGSVSCAANTSTQRCYSFSETGLTLTGVDAGAEIIADPSDAANKIAQIAYLQNTTAWAGAYFDGEKINLSSATKIVTVRSYAPAVGKKITLEFQLPTDFNVKVSKTVTTTKANEWEVLTFDFTGVAFDPAVNYARVLIIPDFPNTPAGKTADGLYRFDNVTYQIGNPPALTAQTITFSQPADLIFPATAMLAPFSDANLPVSLTSNTPSVCTVSGLVVTAVANGTCSLTASQAGNATYAPATSVTRTLTVTGGVTPPAVTCVSTATQQCYGFTESGMAFTPFPNDQGANNPTVAVVNDPVDAANQVVQFDTKSGSPGWAGVTINALGGNKVLPVKFATGAQTATLRVYSPAVGTPFLIKFESSLAAGKDFQVAAKTTTANAWETLTFDFSLPITNTAVFPHRGGTYDPAATHDTVSVFPDFATSDPKPAGAKTYYFDNLTYAVAASSGGGDGGATAPTTAPVTPTKLDANVVSMFSDAYTAPAAIDTPGWGQTTMLTSETIAGNPVFKLTNTNFQGITFPDAGVNVSTHTNLHMDVWSATAGTLQVKLVSLNPTQESPLVTFNVSAGAWTSIDLPMSGFTVLDKTKFAQLVFDGGGGKTYYVDNIYFWK